MPMRGIPSYREKQAEAERKRREGEQHSDNMEIVAALNRVANEQQAANNQNSASDGGKRVREILTIVGIFVTAVVALGQGCIFQRQLHEMEKVYGPIKTQAENAERLAAAANDANIASSDATERQLRAYISPIIPPTVRESFMAVFLRNSGQTPAYEVSHYARIGLPSDGYPIPDKKVLENFTVFPGMIGPVIETHVDITSLATEIEIRLLGRIEYRDAFNRARWTNYCVDFKSLNRGTWDYCPTRNDAN